MQKKTVLLYLALLFWFALPAQAQLTLSIEDYLSNENEEVDIPISVQNFDDIVTIQFTFSWDPTVLQYIDAVEPTFLQNWNSASYNDMTAEDGFVRVVWFDDTVIGEDIDDNTSFMSFKFKVIGDPGDTTQLFFADSPLPAQYGSASDTSPQIPEVENGQLIVDGDVSTLDPSAFGWELKECSPNPFSQTTTIAFTTPKRTEVKWSVIDITGKIIIEQHEEYPAGVNHFVLEQHKIPTSGTYFIKLETPEFINTQKVDFLR